MNDGEVAHTRARRFLRSFSSLTGQEMLFDKTVYVDDVAGKAVGLPTAAAEQALAKCVEQVARATAVPEDEDADGALILPEPEGDREERLWAGAGVDEEEQVLQVGPESRVPPVPAHLPAQNVVSNVRHSVNDEVQVKALQEEAAAENDKIDRSATSFCPIGKGAEGALTGSMMQASRHLAR